MLGMRPTGTPISEGMTLYNRCLLNSAYHCCDNCINIFILVLISGPLAQTVFKITTIAVSRPKDPIMDFQVQ